MNTAPRFLAALQHALEVRVRPADAIVRFTAEERLTENARTLVHEYPRAVFTFDPDVIRFGALPLAACACMRGKQNKTRTSRKRSRGMGLMESRFILMLS